jgi:multicomponent Na+:H+ antiporter subunit F
MTLLEFAVDFGFIVIGISIFVIFIRLVIGPSLEDRIIALDLLSIIGIAFVAIYAISTDNTQVLDVGIILGILAFLGTVAFGYYLERRTKK